MNRETIQPYLDNAVAYGRQWLDEHVEMWMTNRGVFFMAIALEFGALVFVLFLFRWAASVVAWLFCPPEHPAPGTTSAPFVGTASLPAPARGMPFTMAYESPPRREDTPLGVLHSLHALSIEKHAEVLAAQAAQYAKTIDLLTSAYDVAGSRLRELGEEGQAKVQAAADYALKLVIEHASNSLEQVRTSATAAIDAVRTTADNALSSISEAHKNSLTMSDTLLRTCLEDDDKKAGD